MNESNVATRLKTFIEAKGLTYSQFADMCGIPRPSLSQLLTGRNKKISDILVGQIHNMFPSLSIVWLLFGEGKMEVPVNRESDVKEDFNDNIYDEGLFSLPDESSEDLKKIVFNTGNRREVENPKENSLNTYKEQAKEADSKIDSLQKKIKELQSQIENMRQNPRKVAHITVYYDDFTFETFYPK